MNDQPTDYQKAPFFVDREVIILTRNGIWMADGTEITHEPTAKLFARSLEKREDGYYLHIGRETKKIEVEDTAYFVQRIEGEPKTGVSLYLSNQSQEILDPQTLSYRPGRLTCRIKSGQEEAKFLHNPYFDLLRDLQEDQKSYFLEFAAPRKSRINLASK